MNVELDKKDLINLVRGTQPTYTQLENPFISKYRRYSDQYGRYSWNGLEDLSEEQLWNLYVFCARKENGGKV